MKRRIGIFGLFLFSGVPAVLWLGGFGSSAAPVASATPVEAPSVVVPANPENPLVEPGKVRWHATFESALAAAAESKKPVLVFHMMGRLDHRFC